MMAPEKKKKNDESSLSVIKKLQNALRAQTDRARQEAGHIDCHQPSGTQVREETEKTPREPREPSNILRVHQDQALFVNGWHNVVKKFIENEDSKQYVCPPDLNGYDRKMLHQLAEHFNLGHRSYGQGRQRKLILTKDRLFFEHGSLEITKQRLKELEEWTNMRKHFDPESGKIDADTLREIEAAKEYLPGETSAIMSKATEWDRDREDRIAREERLAKLRILNELGVFTDQSAVDDSISPIAPSDGGEQPIKRQKVDDEGTVPEQSDELREYLSSGLAPRTVTVTRDFPDEPLGLTITKTLLVNAVAGVAAVCGVPIDMFITEVNGENVNTAAEFTIAVKDQCKFTLTLWYLRKDGTTVPKLQEIANRAEQALLDAVEERNAIIQETCTVCESSKALSGEEWEGKKLQHCEECGKETEWVIEKFDDNSEYGSDEDEDEEEGKE
eukprot:TRINITY_DN14772_c0_g1_i4.p1 TRINITY_DN14772_c0_g1~~TRINITY_DN14772_c0_g1_i4.p1  ORF type:complete len:444 (+),score=127.13 TRINITY_DN14772_c0_g1_i4:907-2238(+)